MRCTKTQRAEAVALAVEVGPAEAARRLGLNPNTLRSWMARDGQHEATDEGREMTIRATEAKLVSVAERKAQLASDLLDDCQRLRAQLFAPCVERKAMSGGAMRLAEVVEIEHTQPPFSDQRQIMTSLAIAVDKVQILTGEATERIETLVAERRPEAEEQIAQVLALVQDVA